jgi:hypothetical protein
VEENVRVARGVASLGEVRRVVGLTEGVVGELRAGMERIARDVALAANRSSAAEARGIAVRSISRGRRVCVYSYEEEGKRCSLCRRL